MLELIADLSIVASFSVAAALVFRGAVYKNRLRRRLEKMSEQLGEAYRRQADIRATTIPPSYGVCNFCNVPLRRNAKFCSNCGVPVPSKLDMAEKWDVTV